MKHISVSQKIELIREHKDLLVDVLEDKIKEKENSKFRYQSNLSEKEVKEQYNNKILALREIQAIINNF